METNKEKTNDSNENSGKSVLSSVRRFTASSHGHTSPTNGSIAKNSILETVKSPVLRSLSTKSSQPHGERRSPPSTAPKPRPWSMATDRKSGKIAEILKSQTTFIYYSNTVIIRNR